LAAGGAALNLEKKIIISLLAAAILLAIFVAAMWVYPESALALPAALQGILLVCVFISGFLVLFLILNVKQDDTAVIRDRIRKFQVAFFLEYFEKREEINWRKISSDILYRKADLSNVIKKTLGRRGREHRELVDRLLEDSWDEIFAVLGREPGEFHDDGGAEEAEELEELPEAVFDEIRVKKPASCNCLAKTEIALSDGEEPEELIEINGSSIFLDASLFASCAEPIGVYDELLDMIVEQDGLYRIKSQSPILDMEQDQAFKTLVDSVLVP
jgi:CRISPR/Cas system CSM-associated protein Csm2 small subunit